MRLFITAKQSGARSLAYALAHKGRPAEKREDHFHLCYPDGQEDVITWCGGRLLEWAPPETYDPRYRKWRLEDLPIIPEHWELRAIEATASAKRVSSERQLQCIRHWLESASLVVHAGDPDREGQWLIDEVLTYLHCQLPVQRLKLHSLNGQSLRKAISLFEASPPDNTAFQSLSLSAEVRSQADWLYGLNMTRACTLLSRHGGHEEVLSVGRVQTPLLALVVKRDEKIEQFSPTEYGELKAKIRGGEQFCYADFVSSPNMDQSTADQTDLESLATRLQGKPALIEQHDEQHHIISPPLPADLSSLQIELGERFGYSPLEVQNTLRTLYEEHHLISHPLTGCRYLPERMHPEAGEVLASIMKRLSESRSNLTALIENANAWRLSAAWNDAHVMDHHAIVPVMNPSDHLDLSEQEQIVYEWVVRFYVAQFLPDCKVLKKTIHLVVDDSHFICEREIVRNIGWREIIPAHQDDPKPSVEMSIPEWKAEDALVCEDFSIRERKTRPPSRFSEVELMRAMSEILPFIEDEQVRASLKGSDGIGTESTRAYAIDALFKRGYLIKGNKSVFSTSLARALIHALPKEAVDVGMTALWERELSNIAKMPFQEAKQSADHFLLGVVEEIRQFARYAQQRKNIHVSSPEEILGLDHEDKYRCPSCDSVLKLRSGRFGHFWGCSAYPACQTTLQDRIDEQGEHHPIGLSSPVIPAISADTKYLCPKCGSHLKKRQGQHGSFWGCTSYPACTYTTRKPLPH